MKKIAPLLLSLALAGRAFAAEPIPALDAAKLPSDWIDAATGHRVIRLSPDTGGTSLYFHQRGYTPEGDKLVIQTPAGIAAVDLKTLGVSAPKVEGEAAVEAAITRSEATEAPAQTNGVVTDVERGEANLAPQGQAAPAGDPAATVSPPKPGASPGAPQ